MFIRNVSAILPHYEGVLISFWLSYLFSYLQHNHQGGPTFTLQENSWYSFLLEAESTSGP
jgi:hypothetical protein